MYEIIFPEAIYKKYLQTINGIKFTPREIDIIACLLSGKNTQAIANFLSNENKSIELQTVSTHILNIRRKISGNARGSIINFIENSDRHQIIHNYYISLLIQKEFNRSLDTLASLIKPKVESLTILTYKKVIRETLDKGQLQELDKEIPFIKHLEHHFKVLVPKVFLEFDQPFTSISALLTSILEKCYIIHILPSLSQEVMNVNESYQDLQPIFNENDSLTSPDETKNKNNLIKFHSNILLILQEAANYKEELIKESSFKYIEINSQKNYYFLFFESLKKLLCNTNDNPEISIILEDIVRKFNEKYQSIYAGHGLLNSSPTTLPQQFIKPLNSNFYQFRSFYLAILLVIILSALGRVGYLTYKNNYIKQIIRSDLSIPAESELLKRPQIITKMHERLKAVNGSQTITLAGIVGIGGAGKTTIARYYGKFADTSIVWELNAESRYTLINSFRDLAYTLSITPKFKEELSFIQQIQNPETQEKQLVNFVKARLKDKPKWVLIYDNLESFSQIEHLFPRDPNVWGNGKVIITTRNENIAGVNYMKPENLIYVDELSSEEMLTLFSKRVYNCDPVELDNSVRDQTIDFLKNIPPFPLDVSLAAHYIKHTKISKELYLKYVKNNYKEFDKAQKNIISEIEGYNKTRYGLIQLALEKIIERSPKYQKILFFIGLLDSQNIPIELLNKYDTEINIEEFINELRRYSFIAKESSNIYLENVRTFSIHRSIKELCFTILIRELELEDIKQITHDLCPPLKEYLTKMHEELDFSRMKILIPHVEALLSHNKIIDNYILADLYYIVGKIYQLLGNYQNTFSLFQQSILLYQKDNNRKLETSVLIELGYTYSIIGQYKKAIRALTPYLNSIKKYYNTNQTRFAKTIFKLSIANKYAGNYEEAINLMKQSLKIYIGEGDQLNSQRILGNLGVIYHLVGRYKESEKLLEDSLKFFKNTKAQLYHAWVCRIIGSFYNSIGDYQRAQEVLLCSLEYYTKIHGENHIKLLEILYNLSTTYIYMKKPLEAQKYNAKLMKIYELDPEIEININLQGEIYTLMSKYDLAIEALEKKLSDHSEYYGADHVRTAEVINSLGEAYFLKGEFETSEDLFNKALKLFEKHKHPSAFIALENLSEIYLKKYNNELQRNNKQIKDLKDKATNYLIKTLQIVEFNFPAHSSHIERIQLKLKTLSS